MTVELAPQADATSESEATSSVTSKGQVTIPKKVRDLLSTRQGQVERAA
jgi:bifunctional DNA-binding transcriptional regulator/antitoxin component of YhaV-PrlF toxin-antitoxin module